MSLIVYTSPSCPNCVRLLDTLKRIPSLRSSATVVDVNTISPTQIAASGITAVPTIVAQGRMHVGKAAFEFLASYNQEMELESVSFGSGSGLTFGLVGAADTMHRVEQYGDFTAPP